MNSVSKWVPVRRFCFALALVGAGALLGGSVPASADAVAEFNAKTEAIFKEAIGQQAARPPVAGATAVKGKNIVIIPCAMAAEGCARQARGVQEATKVIGWQSTLIDPAGDPSKMADAIQKAISIKADGIIIIAVDAKTLQGALSDAKKAGIMVVAEGEDIGGLYDAIVPENPKKFFFNQGYVVGAAGYVLGGKKLHMVELRDDEFGSVQSRADGTNAFIKDCQAAGGDCKLLAVQNTLVTDLTTQVPKQAVSLVQRNPGYNMLWTGYDAALSFVIQQGLQQADLTDTGFAIGFDANVANTEIIRAGGYERASLGLPLEWLAYAMIDQMNRLLANQPVAQDEGINSRLLSKDTLPATGAWDGDIDFRSEYKKVWGIE
jgi:ribose transport system substrate-binding protein